MPSRPLIALTALSCLFAGALPLTAQDPWTRVPAIPATCYDNSQPGVVGRLQNIRHELVVESDKLTEGNSSLRQKFIDMDPMEKQSKMMAFMMKDPAAAQKMMQDNASSGQKTSQVLERVTEKRKELSEQLKSAETQFAAEKAPLNAIGTRYQATQDPSSRATTAQINQLAGQFDAEYERLCAKWLTTEATSPLLKYLAAVKTYLTTEQIPGELERDRTEKQQLELYGFPGASVKSTAAHKAVIEYLDGMITVYGRLRAAPIGSR